MQTKPTRALEKLIRSALFGSGKAPAENFPLERVFLAMLCETNCHGSHILRKLLKDWEIYQLRIRLEREIERRSLRSGAGGTLDTDTFIDELFSALDEVRRSIDAREGAPLNTGHLLLYVIRERRYVASQILELYHVEAAAVTEYVLQYPPDEDYYVDMQALQQARTLRIDTGMPAYGNERTDEEDDEPDYGGNTATARGNGRAARLEQFGTDLTRAAAEGRIDPVVGREKEIERLVQILGRRKKNNPILIGEAGVGKSAIVEGLALRIASGDIPYALRDKTLFSLDVASLVAGTKYRGQFEERIKTLLGELRNRRDIVLFIDEIHTIVGAGSTQGGLDTANILKPALARGELQCIGATTLDEYRENIESDSALERRFQRIVVEPATREQTLAILRNIRGHYERHHMVHYTDEALAACVDLSARYITDRNFPDKAIDVLDEAGSKAHVERIREPESLRRLETAVREAGERKREAVGRMVYNEAAEARLREMALAGRLGEERARWQRELRLHPVEIGTEQIAEVIGAMTGIPARRIGRDERSRLQGMADRLAETVVGQPEAIARIAGSIRRSRAGLKDPDRPIGVFLFVGPTGVGKTLLAKELARWMFDRDDALVRIDMSEYAEKHNVSRLIGSPPGYVGHNEGGQLTEAIRRQPYSVVLFDEIEKAHPDVFNVMLQLFDEGQLTDGLGRRVDFRNTIIILTGNVGSHAVARRGNVVGYNTAVRPRIEQTDLEHRYRAALEETFAPEFLNRIDDIVIFNTLSLDDVKRIVDLELRKLNRRAEELGYTMIVSDEAREQLARLGYEPRYGVRSLKRIILDRIEEPLAEMIVSGRVSDGQQIDIACVEEEIELLAKAV